MKNYLIILIFILLISCTSNKKVYWCGDHPCVNDKERKSYFKKTMIVEIKEVPVSNKSKSEIQKIKKQALLDQKKRIKEEKELTKQILLEEKKRIKDEKKIIKQARKEEKKRIKEEKELSKKILLDEKKRIKEENKMIKKVSKEEKREKKKIISRKIKRNDNNNSVKKISISTGMTKIDVDTNTFKKIVENINKRNMFRPYPDINNIPN